MSLFARPIPLVALAGLTLAACSEDTPFVFPLVDASTDAGADSGIADALSDADSTDVSVDGVDDADAEADASDDPDTAQDATPDSAVDDADVPPDPLARFSGLIRAYCVELVPCATRNDYVAEQERSVEACMEAFLELVDQPSISDECVSDYGDLVSCIIEYGECITDDEGEYSFETDLELNCEEEGRSIGTSCAGD